MKYSYFGNTSNRVERLLYNFELQLILFDRLFSEAQESEEWANDSSLQIRYLELLREHGLIESKHKTKALGTKDARVKSAPLEDYGLINRKQKMLTERGRELLELIKNQSYRIENEFLQLDLISLFFIKVSLGFSKDSVREGLFRRYLEVFRLKGGTLGIEEFRRLPLIDNFASTEDFLANIDVIPIDYTHLESFTQDMRLKKFNPFYFKTAKGQKSALEIIDVLQSIFLPLREGKLTCEDSLKLLSKSAFKEPYLDCLLQGANDKKEKIARLQEFVKGDEKDFAERFFTLIFKARVFANLDDYLDLNRRYLNLCGIFEFHKDRVSLNPLFNLLMRHSQHNQILDIIQKDKITPTLLKQMSEDREFLSLCGELGIAHARDLKDYKIKRDREKLENLLKTRFSRENVSHILGLFEDRKNDSKITALVSNEASVPTIFEYMIALAWCYIDEGRIERILEAGLSLDSNLLPKSHAVGGNADFVYIYDNHMLMVEVTLTEKNKSTQGGNGERFKAFGQSLARARFCKKTKIVCNFYCSLFG